MADFILVGSGLAGSILALELVKAKQSVIVVSDSGLPSSSRVAGGLINPVTGKFLAKTWLVEELFSSLDSFYRNLETTLGETFYHKVGLFRPFTSDEHKKSSLAQIEKHELHEYIKVSDAPEGVSTFYKSGGEGMLSPQAGWLDLPLMLDLLREYLTDKVTFLEEIFDHSLLKETDDGFDYKGDKAKRIVFCEGFYVKDNPYFNWLPMNPVKGETILGEIEGYNVQPVVNQGKWLIPLGDGKVRLGATYSWHELDFNASEKGMQDLLVVSEKILNQPINVKGSQAGVRPATKDRRPILGRHPEIKNMYIFNGLGTKGVSLAPYFAAQLVNNILHQEVIHDEANIERFYSLYS